LFVARTTLLARLLGLLAVLAPLCLVAPPGHAGSFTDAQKTELDGLIHDYLMRNPEVVIEALRAADEKLKKQADAQARQSIAERRAELTGAEAGPVVGNPKGDVTLVEFFDYRCPYCKQVQPQLRSLIAEDRRLRVVYKEFPILGKASVFAAHAALAAALQGKYEAFHDTMMAMRGRIDDDAVLRVAAAVGCDVPRLRADMERPEIAAAIKRNYALADALGIHGTPAFVLGDELIPGAIDIDELRQRIAALRKG
jgi:protein-disulfide isomerase